jgi:predicted transcriptional regulator
MHNRYRSKIDVITFVLNTANGNGVKQLEILSKANVTQITQGVLFILLEFNLIEYMQNQRTYKTTKKGIRFIDAYCQMKNLVQSQ